jgi:hypothetical protein
LIINLDHGAYICTATSPTAASTVTLPLTVDDLAVAADHARRGLTSVINRVYDGSLVFQDAIDIPADVEQEAPLTLARAGQRLFQRIFQPPAAGADVHAVGCWLIRNGTNPAPQLTLSVFASRVPVPWSMLYLGDAGEGALLDSGKFLGFRHIVGAAALGATAGRT